MKMTIQDDLSSAAATGNREAVEDLLLSGVDVNGVNSFGRTALQVMMMGSSAVAQLLLEHGADPNVSDRRTGATPLHDAARTGFVDTVQLLLQYHADPTARDHKACLPLDLATESGHRDVATFLLECL